MTDLKYHRVLPTSNNLNGFKSYDTIDWLLTGPGRALVNNSITIDFDLEVFVDGAGAAVAAADDIKVNQHVAASSFFDQFQTEIQNQGAIENLQNYPRYCNMVNTATKCDNDCFNSQDIMEGVAPLLSNGKYFLQAETLQSKTTVIKRTTHWAIRPKICFNRAQGGNFSFDKDGYIKVSTTLIRAASSVFGSKVDNTTNFTISNISLRYQTIPKEQAVKQPLLMNSYISIKHLLTSSNNMIQATIPSSACSGCVVSFIAQANESAVTKDSNRMEMVRAIDSLRFMFNSSLSERITYELHDLKDMVAQGLGTMGQSGHNNVRFSNLKANDSWLIGLDFKAYLDLSSTNFHMNIDLSRAIAAPMYAYMYFLNLIRLG